MGDEGLKLHSTTPYQFQGHLKVPAIPSAATDLDFSLDKKVDRESLRPGDLRRGR